MKSALFIVGLIYSSLLWAQTTTSAPTKKKVLTTATTKAGKTIIVYEDGTWEWDTSKEATSTSFDFRKVKWGWNKKQVGAAEKSKASKLTFPDTLTYDITIEGLNAHLIYEFAEEKLARAMIVFDANYSDSDDYIADFITIEKALSGKYGTGLRDEIWSSGLSESVKSMYLKDSFEDRGEAIASGSLQLLASWEAPGTLILLFLKATPKGTVGLTLASISQELKPLLEKASKKKSFGDF